jgi:DNA-directed RNA polymerase specialized sigma subunit
MLDMEKYKRITTSVEEMINSEYASLDEKYAYDFSGDLISTSELDEFDENDSFLGIENEVLVSGSEKETVDEISDKLSRKQMKELIRNELIKLPLRHQSVYDLFFYEQMSVNELAGIKNETPERIEEILEEVKEFLAKRLRIK